MDSFLVLSRVVALLHALGVVYVVAGGLLGLRHPGWLIPHAIAVAWIVISGELLTTCPLTDLQKWLLAHSEAAPYAGNFIDHYFVGTLYPTAAAGLARQFAQLVVPLSWAWVAAAHWRGRAASEEPGALGHERAGSVQR